MYTGPCKKSKLRPRFIFPSLVGWSNHSIPVGTKSGHRSEPWWMGENKSLGRPLNNSISPLSAAARPSCHQPLASSIGVLASVLDCGFRLNCSCIPHQNSQSTGPNEYCRCIHAVQAHTHRHTHTHTHCLLDRSISPACGDTSLPRSSQSVVQCAV